MGARGPKECSNDRISHQVPSYRAYSNIPPPRVHTLYHE